MLISGAMADDIVLKNGHVIRGVTIVKQSAERVYYIHNGEEKSISKTAVERIVDESLNPVENMSINKATERRLHLLPLSFVSLALAYDYYKDASDLNDDADAFEDAGLSSGNLRSRADRKSYVAAICVIFGVANTFVALAPVKVDPVNQMVSLSFNF